MKVSDDVLEVLQRCALKGNSLTLPRLDRAMYLRVDEVLKAAGGKWNRKAKAHLFDSEAETAIEAILLTGEVVKPQDFGFFETSDRIVDLMISHAAIEPGMTFLEPSAGQGRIALRLIEKVRPYSVTCYELLQKNVEYLEQRLLQTGLSSRHFFVVQTDFLSCQPGAEPYDRILMNPPFAKRADIHHIMHAMKFLRPGGKMVAIASASVAFRTDKLAVEFRDFVRCHFGMIVGLPEGSFKEAGTAVNTVMITMEA